MESPGKPIKTQIAGLNLSDSIGLKGGVSNEFLVYGDASDLGTTPWGRTTSPGLYDIPWVLWYLFKQLTFLYRFVLNFQLSFLIENKLCIWKLCTDIQSH